MIVHLDTSILIDALTGPRRSLDALTRMIEEGHRPAVSTIVLYEWLRGPRTRAELSAQEDLFPNEHSVAFTAGEAAVAAKLYATIARPRGREIDIAIAACAMSNDGALWTLNPGDFRDIPGLQLANGSWVTRK
jgi:predicted nucleic acid-binding protein